MIRKVVSGGQTGVDRAALDVALELGLACGGWCPKGRRAEDGPLDPRYPLTETPSAEYRQRTEWNVRDADGTLVLARGALTGGTAQTVELSRRMGKPHLVLNLDAQPSADDALAWADAFRIETLNVAGPREGSRPDIYAQAASLLRRVFARGAQAANAVQ